MTDALGPLDGFRVLDAGTRIAASFCAGALGELGADVIKVEQPGAGEFLRYLGPLHDGNSLMWSVEGRGRKSITLDLRLREGQALLRRLAERVDVLCENFRPGTMERWRLGPSDLPPSLVYVRVSVFGQTGPLARRRGVDMVGIAHGGLLGLTGYPDGPPMKSNITISDHLTGVFAAKAAVFALFRREVDGDGAVVDASLFGSIFRTLDWRIAAEEEGAPATRSGALDPDLPGLLLIEGADGRYVATGASRPTDLDALTAVIWPGNEPGGDSSVAGDCVRLDCRRVDPKTREGRGTARACAHAAGHSGRTPLGSYEQRTGRSYRPGTRHLPAARRVPGSARYGSAADWGAYRRRAQYRDLVRPGRAVLGGAADLMERGVI